MVAEKRGICCYFFTGSVHTQNAKNVSFADYRHFEYHRYSYHLKYAYIKTKDITVWIHINLKIACLNLYDFSIIYFS